jgi:Tol biopolymer transport system component
VPAAGGEIASLPGIPARVVDAQYSPDGSQLAWTDRAGGVYVDARVVVAPNGVKRGDVAWSPDGTQLAYSLRCSGPLTPSSSGCGIGIADVETGAEHELLAGGEPLRASQPTWSPDGSRIAFGRLTGAVCGDGCPPPTDIYSVALDGSDLRRITRDSRWASSPAWSPDGDRIAFVRYDAFVEAVGGNDREIYVVNADGSGQRRLTDDGECAAGTTCRPDDTDGAPAWSPDGRRIAFISDRGEPVGQTGLPVTQQVWEMRADGSGAHRLTATATAKTAVSWRSVPYLVDAAAPDCRDLTATTEHATPVRIALDCQDANGDALALRALDAPAHGELSAPAADGSVRYTPAAGFAGSDTFTYTASDGSADAPPARVTITVAAAPPPPTPTPVPTVYDPGHVVVGGHWEPPPPPPAPNPGPGGGVIVHIPNGCPVDINGNCTVPVGCSGGNRNNCVGSFMEVPTGRKARASKAKPRLVRSLRLTIPAGQQRIAKLRLTARGRAELRRMGRVKAKIRFELCRAGKLEQALAKTIVFKRARRARH